MLQEIEDLKTKLERKYHDLQDDDIREWQEHPVTKAFKAGLVSDFIDAIDMSNDYPVNEQAKLDHIKSYGVRDAIKQILDGRFFEESDNEE